MTTFAAQAVRATALATLLAIGVGAALTGCRAGGDPRGEVPGSAADAGSHRAAAGSDKADPALAAIESAIAELNSAAGGPVAAQRALLEELVAPADAADQAACPPATTTLSFDPAYRDMRHDPSGDANQYLLPVYINIFTGARITGSDLATLHLSIINGEARTAALCVS